MVQAHPGVLEESRGVWGRKKKLSSLFSLIHTKAVFREGLYRMVVLIIGSTVSSLQYLYRYPHVFHDLM